MPSLIQITDTHLLADPDGVYGGYRTQASLDRVLAAIARQPPPDLLVVSGDLVQDESEAGYRRLDGALAPLADTVLTLPGNHDDPSRMTAHMPRARLLEPVGLDGWQVLPLSSHVPGETGGRVADDALDALDRRLAAHPEHALVVVHHPPLPLGSAWIDAIGLVNGADLLAILDRHPQVRAVLFGHAHQHWRGWRGHYRLLGTPSTCRQFKPGSPTFAVDRRAPAYRWMDLRDDGRMVTRVRRVPSALNARSDPGCG